MSSELVLHIELSLTKAISIFHESLEGEKIVVAAETLFFI